MLNRKSLRIAILNLRKFLLRSLKSAKNNVESDQTFSKITNIFITIMLNLTTILTESQTLCKKTTCNLTTWFSKTPKSLKTTM